MIVLGIDPGTQRAGYGFVEKTGNILRLLDAGILHAGRGTPPEVFSRIKSHLDALITKFHPDRIAIERLYFVKNQKTAMSVAEARGVIILTAGEYKIPVSEYNPNEIKLAITGYGAADKRAVSKMVRIILREPALSVLDDVSDALAVAIVACGNLSPLSIRVEGLTP